MRTVKTLKPGQKGAKDLLTRFGRVFCVSGIATTKKVASM